MIRTDRANRISAHVQKRSESMKVKRLSPTKFRVTPSEKGRPIRNVEFFLDGSEGEAGARIDCYEEVTLKSCPANICERMCSHVNAAIREL